MLHLTNTQFTVRFAMDQAAPPYIDSRFWDAHKDKQTEDNLRAWLTELKSQVNQLSWLRVSF